MFNKTIFMKLIMTLMAVTMILSMNKEITMEMCMINSETNMISFSMAMNKLSLTFMMMVSMVTSTVMSYSSIYMESYNKKKFFWIMTMFFCSMMILSFSNSVAATITGWDGLGITSIILIMTYQNNTTISNSMLTMLFNRIGDFTMFMAIYSMMSSMTEKFTDDNNLMNSMTATMLMITAMTKSAQVPLSSWLPAAMSAPTPISAMVHSSTLVTAGVYLMMKMYESSMNIFKIISPISCITLMMASISANTEKDLKKIIAFSTMSQISIIMIMCSVKMKTLAMAHMLNHAMFKTMTFMSSGTTFLENNSSQDKRKIKMLSNSKMNKTPLMTSMISMSGTPFSASFFSKDKFMETMKWENKTLSISMIMVLSSIATVLYCKKIMSSLSNHHSKIMSTKKLSNLSFISLSMISTMMGSASNWILNNSIKPILQKKEVILINMTTLLSSFTKNIKSYKKIEMISNNMIFMKWITSNMFYKIKSSKEVEMMDMLNMMPTMWKFKKTLMSNNYKLKMSLITSMMMMIMMLF